MFSVNALGPLDLDHAVLYCVSGGFVPWTTMEHARYILVPDQDHCIQRSVMISRRARELGPESKRCSSKHNTLLGQTTSLFSLALSGRQGCPPAHILECPCPTWLFQCEMDVSKVPAWTSAVAGNDRLTPHESTHVASTRWLPASGPQLRLLEGPVLWAVG